jgi:RelE toxin of RelE / RelB toxin-antitoxin system
MFTFVETPLFQSLWPDYWTEEERAEFVVALAHAPDAGDVVPGSGGVRKMRWTRRGTGKRGGVRVVYFARVQSGQIWLLLIYAKSAKDNVPAHVLKLLKQEIDHAAD